MQEARTRHRGGLGRDGRLPRRRRAGEDFHHRHRVGQADLLVTLSRTSGELAGHTYEHCQATEIRREQIDSSLQKARRPHQFHLQAARCESPLRSDPLPERTGSLMEDMCAEIRLYALRLHHWHGVSEVLDTLSAKSTDPSRSHRTRWCNFSLPARVQYERRLMKRRAACCRTCGISRRQSLRTRPQKVRTYP